MQVFKAYLKVLRGSRLVMGISFFVFLSIAVIFSFVVPASGMTEFESTRIPIAVIDRDGGVVSRGLIEYLSEIAQVVPYPDDPEALQDALFYRYLEYIVFIPPGFSQEFALGGTPVLEKVTVPGSVSSHYMDINIDKFLDTVNLHYSYGDSDCAVKDAIKSLSFNTPVTVRAVGGSGEPPNYSYYYAYSGYALLGMVMTGVSSIMLRFNQKDLYHRNLCAPLPRRKMNLQIAAGHGILALGCWILLLLFSLVLYGRTFFGMRLFGLYALNTGVFAAVCAALGLIIGALVTSSGAQAGIVNVTSLALSFLGGMFVPQEIMNPKVLAVSKFLPSYWFIHANDRIWRLPVSGASSFLRPIYDSILMQIGFAAAIFSAALLLAKEQGRKEL